MLLCTARSTPLRALLRPPHRAARRPPRPPAAAPPSYPFVAPSGQPYRPVRASGGEPIVRDDSPEQSSQARFTSPPTLRLGPFSSFFLHFFLFLPHKKERWRDNKPPQMSTYTSKAFTNHSGGGGVLVPWYRLGRVHSALCNAEVRSSGHGGTVRSHPSLPSPAG